MKTLHALTSIAAGVALALAGTTANAGIFPQCPEGATPAPISNPGMIDTTTIAQADAKVCAHLAAGDGWALKADGGRHYTFGFSNMTNVANDQVVLKGLFNAKWSAPTLAFREGQEVYLALSNVGLLLRPDLFDPHSIHFHGFPQAAPIYDGVPDSSAVVNTGSTFTYYYKVNDPGTYIYHCHVESSEHMQMGMLGTLYVKPKQDQLPTGTMLGSFAHVNGTHRYAYNDGDGSTRYDVDFPVQLGGFDGPFHDLHEAVQPLPFHEMRSTHTFINGRGYPDTVVAGALPPPEVEDGVPATALPESSQPVSALITATAGQRILLRMSNTSVTEYFTVTALGLPMRLVGQGAAIARGMSDPTASVVGKEWAHDVGSLTLGGGESVDVVIDTTGIAAGTYFLYTTNLNYLSNGNEDRGGIMTHIVINPSI
jgi:FtsP/CotA-like multicopper oxidase with cupredoxin domain